MPLNATLHIETALRHEKTVLKKSFCTQPFKIANITESKLEHELQLMLMSSSPGILDEDCYQLTVDVGEGCALSLQTQSYQRIFQMKKGATQTLTMNLAEGSSVVYLPHPLVPHQHSIFQARNKIYLSDGCSLLWGEIISCGRKLNGEIFQFSLYHGITEIFLKNKLVVKENLLLKPLEMNMASIGQLEGFTHQATLLYLTERIDVSFSTTSLIEFLQQSNQVIYGISALPVNGILVRLLGHSAEQLFGLLKDLSGLLQTFPKIASKLPERYVS